MGALILGTGRSKKRKIWLEFLGGGSGDPIIRGGEVSKCGGCGEYFHSSGKKEKTCVGRGGGGKRKKNSDVKKPLGRRREVADGHNFPRGRKKGEKGGGYQRPGVIFFKKKGRREGRKEARKARTSAKWGAEKKDFPFEGTEADNTTKTKEKSKTGFSGKGSTRGGGIKKTKSP